MYIAAVWIKVFIVICRQYRNIYRNVKRDKLKGDEREREREREREILSNRKQTEIKWLLPINVRVKY